MHFTSVATLALAATCLGSAIVGRDNSYYNDMDDSFNIFRNSAERFEGAICKDQITTRQFPTLQIPYGFRGGCVRCMFSTSTSLTPFPQIPN